MEEKKKDEQMEGKREKVRLIPIQYLDDAPKHPFQVRDDAEMEALIESVAAFGVISPILVKKKEDGRYELISGHRRKHACEKLGIETIPTIVREMSKEEAIITMVDSNLQREHILPSERAFAYKLKMDAMRKKAGRPTKDNLTPVVSELRTDEIVGSECGESREQVRRYIRLTHLIPELLEDVDMGKIAFRPAVELSYLGEEEQKDLSYTIDEEEATPSLSQAMQMRRLSEAGVLDLDRISAILLEDKPNQVEKIKIQRRGC